MAHALLASSIGQHLQLILSARLLLTIPGGCWHRQLWWRAALLLPKARWVQAQAAPRAGKAAPPVGSSLTKPEGIRQVVHGLPEVPGWVAASGGCNPLHRPRALDLQGCQPRSSQLRSQGLGLRRAALQQRYITVT